MNPQAACEYACKRGWLAIEDSALTILIVNPRDVSEVYTVATWQSLIVLCG